MKTSRRVKESRPLLTTVRQTATFSHEVTVPSLYILRLNKYSQILNSLIGLGSNRIITNYSNRSKNSNIRTALILVVVWCPYSSEDVSWAPYITRPKTPLKLPGADWAVACPTPNGKWESICSSHSSQSGCSKGKALHGNPISELRDVTCHMGSHSVICHPTQVNAPCLTPCRLVLDLPTTEGWKAELS